MNEEFMKLAIELSKESVKQGGGPFGAVVVKNGKVIAACTNSVVPDSDPTAHAEINALRAAARTLGTFDLNDCEIYASCEPCPMCLGAIYWSKIKKLYYANTKQDAASIGFDDSFIYDEIATPPTLRTLKSEQLLRHEALAAFNLWREKTDKTEY